MPKSQFDEEVLEELIKEGLIKKDQVKGDSLTGYGEIIEIMGYSSHKKRKQKSFAMGKEKWMKSYNFYILILIFAALCGFLVLI